MIRKEITVTTQEISCLTYSTKIRSRNLKIPLLVPTLSPVNFTPSCHHQFLNVIIVLDPINSEVKF